MKSSSVFRVIFYDDEIQVMQGIRLTSKPCWVCIARYESHYYLLSAKWPIWRVRVDDGGILSNHTHNLLDVWLQRSFRFRAHWALLHNFVQFFKSVLKRISNDFLNFKYIGRNLTTVHSCAAENKAGCFNKTWLYCKDPFFKPLFLIFM